MTESEPDTGRKVVHVSIVHPATDVRIFTKQCTTLRDAGYDVTLYARTDAPHVEAGIPIRPVPCPRSRATRMTIGVWRLLRPLLAERADLYHFHDPELIPLAFALRLRGKRVVFDAHEPLPLQIYDKHWIPEPLRPLVSGATRLLVRLAGRLVHAIVAASPLAAEAYAAAHRIVTVNNYPIVLEGDDYNVPYPKRTRDLVYVGGITDGRGFDEMVAVANRIFERTGERLTLVGPFQPPELEAAVRAAAPAVDYLGVLPPADARQVMAEAKVGLLLFQQSRAHERSMPNKLFEYMASGLPVVASNFAHWREIIADADAGVVVRPDDVDAIEAAAAGLLADPERAERLGDNGRLAATERYTWASEAETLLALYDDLLGR